MGLHGASGSEIPAIILNAVVRFAQLVVAAAALGVYGTQKGYWLDHDLPGRIDFELAIGSLALITALVLMVIPLFLSYRPVAWAAPWDLLLFILWAAAFGLMKAIFIRTYTKDETLFKVTNPDDKVFDDHWKTMARGVWIDLAGMILSLISAIMGAVLLWIGRRSGGRASHV